MLEVSYGKTGSEDLKNLFSPFMTAARLNILGNLRFYYTQFLYLLAKSIYNLFLRFSIQVIVDHVILSRCFQFVEITAQIMGIVTEIARDVYAIVFGWRISLNQSMEKERLTAVGFMSCVIIFPLINLFISSYC